MPLLKGSSKETIAANISELRHAGHPERQAIAIAMKTANKHKGKLKRVADKVVKQKRFKPYGMP